MGCTAIKCFEANESLLFSRPSTYLSHQYVPPCILTSEQDFMKLVN